ncbi:TnpV protein [Brachybacterium sp. J144]|uniref:TnpV protein n=1 Tax=Brachybacterium sp. J144 TaxID=3116487 RepID=UPI002E789A94|nr:TnpV protein [Brachybacterium sp. J144]MEE1652179.1 TnpV protein [Brachybacterium sp. J144]
MNKYANLLQQQWTAADPTYVSSLDDPTTHFAQMGERVQEEILELLPSLEGTDPAAESYLQKVGRLNAARQQAEEIVLAEYQPPSVTPEPDEPEDWDEMSHDEQETWIRQNVPTGEQQDEMLQALEARRLNRTIVLGASSEPRTGPED